MSHLTIEMLASNPTTVLDHELPANPSRLLLSLAQLAATFCRQHDSRISLAGDTVGVGRELYGASIARFFVANRKVYEIMALREEKFDEAVYDIDMSESG